MSYEWIETPSELLHALSVCMRPGAYSPVRELAETDRGAMVDWLRFLTEEDLRVHRGWVAEAGVLLAAADSAERLGALWLKEAILACIPRLEVKLTEAGAWRFADEVEGQDVGCWPWSQIAASASELSSEPDGR